MLCLCLSFVSSGSSNAFQPLSLHCERRSTSQHAFVHPRPRVTATTRTPREESCTVQRLFWRRVPRGGHEHYGSAKPDDDSVDKAYNATQQHPSEEDSTTTHHDHHGPVRHQVEHRATEKGTLAISQRLTERFVHDAERAGRRLSEKAGERLAAARGVITRTTGVHAAAVGGGERAAERGLERVGQSAAERSGRRTAERGLERSAQRAGERVSERAADRVGERLAERAAERTGNRVLERGGEKAGERVLERVADHAGEMGGKALGRGGERTVERVGERAGERALEGIGERTTERALGRSGERALQRVSLRIGRGLMVALPLIGAFFTLYLFKSDYDRWKEEERFATDWRSFPLALFAGAGVADFIDGFLHVGIAYGLLAHFSHRRMALLEKLSVRCAVISTFSAVLGEIWSLRIRKRAPKRGDGAHD